MVKELADVIVNLFSIILKVLTMDRIPEGWKKTNVLPIFRKEKGSYKTVSLILISGKVMDQIILETISKCQQGD